MRILADENCDRVIVAQLRAGGHDVLSVAESMPGSSDPEIFAHAVKDQRMLLTHDHDFGLIAERAAQRPPAVVLMRLDPLSIAARAAMVSKAFETLGKDWLGRFVVIEPEQVRHRAFKR